ncbi:NnrS family protein [Sphingorhabdus sp. Alg239-R122]|uniref:NnrS family protein n=1 Tax=Sphingorhabdus sp. Alg239-R122 TaxID=2305989 RepID=UPI0013D91F34|nr:NnrS family protein [Sphingorhabdus sp. Alg239-R122]
MRKGERSAPGEKRRAYNGPALFSHGFRPFFFCAALFAGLAIPAWMAAFSHGYGIGTGGNALTWHIHEMIYGYLAAAIAGFVMTAIPNWTGRLPVMGLPLALLVLLWLAGRMLMFGSDYGMVTPIVDSLFLVIVAGFAWREILAGKNKRNLPICLLLSLFALSNVLFHFEEALGLPYQTGMRLGITVVTVLMMLIGGRIIPSFTTNWMRKQGILPEPAPFGGYDKIAMLVAALTLVGWVIAPNAALVGYGLVAVAIMHFVRLRRWRGWQTARDPLMLVLHIAYAWIPAAFLLMGLAILRPEALTAAHAMHALTAGAAGQLTLAIMTRASLGHGGRELRAGAGTIAIYILAFTGALLRMIFPFTGMGYALGMSIAGIVWASAFLLFAILYAPLFFTKRR